MQGTLYLKTQSWQKLSVRLVLTGRNSEGQTEHWLLSVLITGRRCEIIAKLNAYRRLHRQPRSARMIGAHANMCKATISLDSTDTVCILQLMQMYTTINVIGRESKMGITPPPQKIKETSRMLAGPPECQYLVDRMITTGLRDLAMTEIGM